MVPEESPFDKCNFYPSPHRHPPPDYAIQYGPCVCVCVCACLGTPTLNGIDYITECTDTNTTHTHTHTHTHTDTQKYKHKDMTATLHCALPIVMCLFLSVYFPGDNVSLWGVRCTRIASSEAHSFLSLSLSLSPYIYVCV